MDIRAEILRELKRRGHTAYWVVKELRKKGIERPGERTVYRYLGGELDDEGPGVRLVEPILDLLGLEITLHRAKE